MNDFQLHLWREELARSAGAAIVREVLAKMTHDLNQPLTAILSNVQALQLLSRDWLDRHADARQILSDIVDEDRRAVELLRGVRAALGPALSRAEPTDVNELVQEIVMMEGPRLLVKNCNLDLELARGLPRLPLDRVQMQLVLINLLFNAEEAMGDTADRRIGIRTSRNGQDRVRIAITDNGVGVRGDPTRIFDAFYSTKPNRLGVGLTLAKSIVEKHGGQIGFYRDCFDRTVFFVDLFS